MFALEVVKIALDVRKSTLQVLQFLMEMVPTSFFAMHEVCTLPIVILLTSVASWLRMLNELPGASRALLACIATHVCTYTLLVLSTRCLACEAWR
jgi:hypothetical protein